MTINLIVEDQFLGRVSLLTGGSLAWPSGVAPVWLLAQWPGWHTSSYS